MQEKMRRRKALVAALTLCLLLTGCTGGGEGQIIDSPGADTGIGADPVSPAGTEPQGETDSNTGATSDSAPEEETDKDTEAAGNTSGLDVLFSVPGGYVASGEMLILSLPDGCAPASV